MHPSKHYSNRHKETKLQMTPIYSIKRSLMTLVYRSLYWLLNYNELVFAAHGGTEWNTAKKFPSSCPNYEKPGVLKRSQKTNGCFIDFPPWTPSWGNKGLKNHLRQPSLVAERTNARSTPKHGRRQNEPAPVAEFYFINFTRTMNMTIKVGNQRDSAAWVAFHFVPPFDWDE